MPKERRERSVSFDRSRASPYHCSSSLSRQPLSKNPLENEENVKDWEDARCPVCMEHPHNAILLLCSSHAKGCRPFMCDTSYRHSNCFDQFKKAFEKASSSTTQQAEMPASASLTESATVISEALSDLPSERSEGGSITLGALSCENHEKKKMQCPLCRGQINDWIVVESARHYMNAKLRSCSSETCDFSGTYTDLRKHARQVHPSVRPTEADPERQRSWRRLERQRDLGDLLRLILGVVAGLAPQEPGLSQLQGDDLQEDFGVRPMTGKLIPEMMTTKIPMEGQVAGGALKGCVDNQHQKIKFGPTLVRLLLFWDVTAVGEGEPRLPMFALVKLGRCFLEFWKKRKWKNCV